MGQTLDHPPTDVLAGLSRFEAIPRVPSKSKVTAIELNIVIDL